MSAHRETSYAANSMDFCSGREVVRGRRVPQLTCAMTLLCVPHACRCEELNCVDFTDGLCESHNDRNAPFNI